MSFPQSAGRFVVIPLFLVFAFVSFATQPTPAALTSVDLMETTPERIEIVLEIRGRVDRVETMRFGDGRFVFDLAEVAWDGPSNRGRPGGHGVVEYRYSQLSRDPLVTRFVVETVGGWSCRHEPAPRGLRVVCGGPPMVGGPDAAALNSDIAVVRGIGLLSPVEGLDAEGLIDLSLGFVPRDMVRDGLPYFGAMRDDWLGAPRSHKGLDIYGDKVFVQAAAEGKVAGSGDGEKAGGWVKIGHGNGVETVYVHISQLSVRTGDSVTRGQRIAVIDGPAGNAIQAQLHFEIKLDGQSVDPVPFIFERASEDLQARITAANQRLAILEQERASRVLR
ncbi:MAG: peptidoglycan DD-metalloendopeptidase family protein [Thermoanaerobaculales bacterium]|nr:peptidoglycan DD-metalloendopeptidase family protein [Thermoanaerobaculales bacterium]